LILLKESIGVTINERKRLTCQCAVGIFTVIYTLGTSIKITYIILGDIIRAADMEPSYDRASQWPSTKNS